MDAAGYKTRSTNAKKSIATLNTEKIKIPELYNV